mmetsp:Transcript_107348/g.270003  ORF Transcript_107348/g.270003 Transcript_107348/m.270003 type:complete len:337 (-) Transcript_107348:324-1334(-)
MAAFSSALPPCMLNDSDGPSVCRVVSVAASQADRSISEKLPEISHRLSRSSKRLGSWAKQSSLSTWSAADEDSEWETLDSPRDFGSVVGRVQVLSHSRDGSLQVRDALDQAPLMDRMLLVQEMHGHTLRAMRCPHANHVLQKIISIMPQASLQFIVDEIMQYRGMASKMATHRYGGLIVQQLLETCEASQVGGLVEILLQSTVMLSRHAYGNSAIQSLLKFGLEQQRYRCLRAIEQNVGFIARSSFGVCVVAAAMEYASPQDRVWTARAVLQDPKLLPHLAQMQDGYTVVEQSVCALPQRERARACQSLTEGAIELLRVSRHGRKILAALQARVFA